MKDWVITDYHYHICGGPSRKGIITAISLGPDRREIEAGRTDLDRQVKSISIDKKTFQDLADQWFQLIDATPTGTDKHDLLTVHTPSSQTPSTGLQCPCAKPRFPAVTFPTRTDVVNQCLEFTGCRDLRLRCTTSALAWTAL